MLFFVLFERSSAATPPFTDSSALFLISFLSSIFLKEHLLAEIEGIRVEKAMQAILILFPITN